MAIQLCMIILQKVMKLLPFKGKNKLENEGVRLRIKRSIEVFLLCLIRLNKKIRSGLNMCATIGFAYREGMVFGRTLELGVSLDNKILMVPKNTKDFTRAKDMNFSTKYSVIGSGFFDIASFGDGINEKGLMGSTNFFPGYASFAKESMEGKINMTTSNAFDYLLSRCANVD